MKRGFLSSIELANRYGVNRSRLSVLAKGLPADAIHVDGRTHYYSVAKFDAHLKNRAPGSRGRKPAYLNVIAKKRAA